jgi:polysaccharide export outer membrane protein
MIDENGMLTLPRLGTRAVVDQSPDLLKQTLIVDYAKYLTEPTIEVTILRRVNVIGAVARPGLYPADPTITLLDLLAMAGGPSLLGMTDRVVLVRNGERTTLLLNQALPPGISAVESGDQLYVPERSWLSRNVIVIPVIIGALASIYNAIHR